MPPAPQAAAAAPVDDLYDSAAFAKPKDWMTQAKRTRAEALGSTADVGDTFSAFNPPAPSIPSGPIVSGGGLFGANDFKEKEAGFTGASAARKPTLFDDADAESELKSMMESQHSNNPAASLAAIMKGGRAGGPGAPLAASKDPEEYVPQPKVTAAQRQKTLAMFAKDSDSDKDDEFVPEKKVAAALPLPKTFDDDDSDEAPMRKKKDKPLPAAPAKPLGKAGIGLPPPPAPKEEFAPDPKNKYTIKKTVAFANSDDDSDEGFANITMKKPAAAPKPKAKLGNLFGDAGDSDDDDGGLGGGLKKPPVKKGLPAMPPAKPSGRKNTLAGSDDEDDFRPKASPQKAPAPSAPKTLPSLPGQKPKPVAPAAPAEPPKPPAPKAEPKNDDAFKANLAAMIAGPRPTRQSKKQEEPKPTQEELQSSLFVSATDSA